MGSRRAPTSDEPTSDEKDDMRDIKSEEDETGAPARSSSRLRGVRDMGIEESLRSREKKKEIKPLV